MKQAGVLGGMLLLLGVQAIAQEYIQINGQGAYGFLNPVFQDGRLISGTLTDDSRFEIPLFTPQGQSFVSVHFQRGTEVIFTYLNPPLLGERMLIGYPVRGVLARDLILTLEGLGTRAVFRASTPIEFQYRFWERGSLRYEFALIREGVLRGPVTARTPEGERPLLAGIPYRFSVVQTTPLPVLALE